MHIHLTSFPMGNNAIKHPNKLAIIATNTLTPNTNLPIGKIGNVNEIVNKQNAIFRPFLTQFTSHSRCCKKKLKNANVIEF